MPLLCISVLVLLLLPWSLPCDLESSQKTAVGMAIVQTHLQNAIKYVTDSLQSSNCSGQPKHRTPNCTAVSPEKINILEVLRLQTCKMHTFGLPPVEKLANNVQDLINCPCPKKPSKEATARQTKGTTGKTRKLNKPHRLGKKNRKLCKAEAFLSSMTVCFQMLNTLLMAT